MKILVTGGAGFIGAALIRHLIEDGLDVVILDKLTYAGTSPPRLAREQRPHCILEIADVADAASVAQIFTRHRPDAVMHLAAESHVDRSIDDPTPFIHTNLLGTFTMLEAARGYWSRLDNPEKSQFRFHLVSTDEVFGSLPQGTTANETSAYQPNSPYAATKAGADHLARAWHRTFGLPVITTNCSNNYGPGQFPEKLIPTIIINALAGEPLPVYGCGENVRDWLYVDDHAAALALVLRHGQPGHTYNIAGRALRANIEIVDTLCAILDAELPTSPFTPHRHLVRFVADRPGHDLRYSVNDSKIREELGWMPRETLYTGLTKTVRWYLEHRSWWESIRRRIYQGDRLGVPA